MKYFSRSMMICIYIIVLLFTELTVSVSVRFPGGIKDGSHKMEHRQNPISPDDTTDPFRKRACNGFPCMYSHLGTKAAHASLYNTLAGFIDDCFNDPDCDPGRRKRDNADRLRKLINTPVSKLHIFGGHKSPKNVS